MLEDDDLETPQLDNYGSTSDGVDDALAAAWRADNPHDDPLPAGSEIGRYFVEQEVGRGGMGVVLKVRDRELKRSLALKAMRPMPDGSDASDGLKMARFKEEAQVTAQLDHPGIVPVHEFGQGPDGVYFTMGLVKGKHLGRVFELAWREVDGWNLSRAVGALVKVCNAIAYAHSNDVIHRDLKPSNVMVGRFGAVYVMDWGLAKVRGKEDLHDLRLKLDPEIGTFSAISTDRNDSDGHKIDSPLITMDGSVIGTPAFMSPEQAKGLIEEVDSSSDIYSLGTILYTLLTHAPPYVDTTVWMSPYTILGLVIHGPPKSILELNPEAPAELVAICEKAMARDKQDRYATSLDLGEDLQAFLDRRVVRAYRTGAFAEFKSWVNRNRATASSVATAVSVFVVGLVLSTSLGLRAWDQQQALREKQEQSRQVLYARDMDLAMKAWESGNPKLVREHLDRAEATGSDLLAFEWFYLNRLCEQSNSALFARFTHEQIVTAAAFSPDGKLLASGCDDGTLRIWDVEGRQESHELSKRHHRPIRGLKFIGEGSRLISADDGGEIWLWEADDIRGEHKRFSGLTDSGYSVVCSPDGTYVAANGPDSTAQIWTTADPKALPLQLKGHTAYVNTLCFTSDGERLVTCSNDGTVRLWDASDGELLGVIGEDSDVSAASQSREPILLVAASIDGKLASLTKDRLRIHDIDSRELVGSYGVTSSSWAEQLVFSKSGNQLAYISGHGDVTIWKIAPGQIERLVPHPDQHINLGRRFRTSEVDQRQRTRNVLPLLSGPNDFVAVTGDNQMKIWQDGHQRADLYASELEIYCTAVSPVGNMVATGGRDYQLAVWDSSVKHPESILKGHHWNVWGIAMSSDGSEIVTADGHGYLRLWSSRDGRLLAYLSDKPQIDEQAEPPRAHASRSVVAMVSGQGNNNMLASVAEEGHIKLWDLAKRKLVRQTPDGHKSAGSVACALDGTRIITGGHDGLVRFWRTQDLQEDIKPLGPIEGQVYAVGCSPNGELIAAGGTDNLGHVWNLGSGEHHILQGHTAPVTSVEFSKDGRILATSSHDGTVRLWQTSTLRELPPPQSPLRGHSGEITGSQFLPDGRSLATVSFDGTIRLWDFRTGDTRCVFTGHSHWVHCVTFSPDCQTMVTGSWDNTARIWRAPRNLSTAQTFD